MGIKFFLGLAAVLLLIVIVGFNSIVSEIETLIYAAPPTGSIPGVGSGALSLDGNKLKITRTSSSETDPLPLKIENDYKGAAGERLSGISFESYQGRIADSNVKSILGKIFSKTNEAGNDVSLNFDIEKENSPVAGDKIALNFKIGGDTKLTINKDSKVGIGTTTPASKLHVVGDTRIDGVLDLRGSLTSGDEKVWGQGQPGVGLYDKMGVIVECLGNGKKASQSTRTVPRRIAALACPAGTWVCSYNDLPSSCSTGSLPDDDRPILVFEPRDVEISTTNTSVNVDKCRFWEKISGSCQNTITVTTSTTTLPLLSYEAKTNTSRYAWVSDLGRPATNNGRFREIAVGYNDFGNKINPINPGTNSEEPIFDDNGEPQGVFGADGGNYYVFSELYVWCCSYQ